MLKYLPIVLLFSLLTLQPADARVRCFLFICHTVRTHVHAVPVHHYRHGSRRIEEMDCDPINAKYNATLADQSGRISRDDFVKSYPTSQQHRVLECIGDL